MKKNSKIYQAKCRDHSQYFLIETQDGIGEELVVNFVDITDEQRDQIANSGAWGALRVSPELRSCRWCGTRDVGSCNCQKDRGCPPKGTYRYPCLFCRQLIPDTARVGDVRNLRLSVTSPHYDDIGQLLSAMGLTVSPFSKLGYECDILFLNCGTEDKIDPVKLREFVRNGGCVYASDWAASHLHAAFPDAINTENRGDSGMFHANVIDPELKSVIGDAIDVNYDLGAWAKIRRHKGNCLICGASRQTQIPMMVTFQEGKGSVFYTSFHNYKQASEKEQAVLKMMLLRQISTVCNQTIGELKEILGLNISV